MTTPFNDPAARDQRRAAIRRAMVSIESARGHSPAEAEARADLTLDLHDALHASPLPWADACLYAGIDPGELNDGRATTQRLRLALGRIRETGR